MKILLWVISSVALAEGPLDSGKDIFFPEFDYKYIQFLPEGHLVKNKPRYRKLTWQVWESKHFEIFTHDSSKELAEFYLTEAEKIYEEYSQRTKMNSFAEKIKVVLYNSVRDCQETNMVPGLWPEALGGLTEMVIWKRVTMAFRDSPMGFRHVIRHELYHRYQAEFLKKSVLDFGVWSFEFPLWFVEGSAEYFSTTWDADKESILRDAYLNDYLASATEVHWQPSLIYTEGHFAVSYLAERYKNKGDVVSNIIRASKDLPFAQAFEQVTGESLEKFNQELNFYVENRWHNLRAKRDLTDDAKAMRKGVLLDARDDFFITKNLRDGRIVLSLNWSNGVKVYSKEFIEDGRLNSAALHGLGVENSPSFGFPESGAVFGRDNEIIYSIDAGERDEIRIQEFSFDRSVDQNWRNSILFLDKIPWLDKIPVVAKALEKQPFKLGKLQSYKPKGVTDIRTPVRVSEDQLAFIGRGSVFAEVFLFNRKTGEVKQLSSLKRNCHSLTYSPYLNALVVSAENEKTGSYDLAICKLTENRWELLTETQDNEWDPKFSPDGKKLLYVSDRDLAHNIYLWDFEIEKVSQLTDVRVGVFRPAWHGANGIWFNSFSNQKLQIQTVPLPILETQPAAALNSATSLSGSETESASEFLCYVPDLTDWTIMDTVFSEDKTKALFVVNRRLSLRELAKGETDLGFCVIDKESGKFWKFSLRQVDDLDLFASAQFLAGNKILLKNMIGEQEELFIYDWEKRDLQFLDPGKIFGFRLKFFWSTSKPTFSRVSPDRKFVVLIRNQVLVWGQKVMVYDVLAGRFAPTHFYKEMVDVLFPDENNALVVGWVKKKGLLGPKDNVLALINLSTNEAKELGIELDDEVISAHSLNASKTVVLITGRGEKRDQSFNVWILDPARNTVRKILSDLPVVKVADASQEDVLVLETITQFGLKRTFKIGQNGEAEPEAENQPAACASVSAFAPLTPLDEQILHFDADIPKRVKSPKSLPRKYLGQFGGSHTSKIINFYLALWMLDELNNQELNGYVAIQGKQQGYADVRYSHFPSGRSIGVLYWNGGVRSKLELSLSQNIFLDRFLNWDITVKEQRIQADYWNRHFQFWQTKFGTTFSLNDTTWDPHGPHTGNAVFSGAEIGLKNGSEYQALDLNFDARTHWPLTLLERFSLAFRFAGGTSLGPHPTNYIGGGNQTLRGILLFGQSGNNYAFQSSELRLPVMDFFGGKFSSDFLDSFFGYAIRFYDIRGGFYSDVGDIWHNHGNSYRWSYLDHEGFKLQYSAGYFLNAPFMALYGGGMNVRFNQGLYGNKDWSFWLGYDW